jgi:hypothetical protein
MDGETYIVKEVTEEKDSYSILAENGIGFGLSKKYGTRQEEKDSFYGENMKCNYFDIKKVSELIVALNDFMINYGDLPVYIDTNDFEDCRTIDSVNFASKSNGEKFICLNNYD